MTDIKEIKSAVAGMADAFEAWKANRDPLFRELAESQGRLADRLEDLETRASRPARSEFAITANSAEAKAFERYLKSGDRTGIPALEGKEMSIGGGASVGGAMVPEAIARQIIDRAIARSPLASMVRNTPVTTSDYVRLVNLRGTTANWSSETGTRSATSTPELREVRPTHGELFSYPAVTNWLLQDSQFNVTSFLIENVSDQFSKSLEYAILFGSGSSQPTGVFNSTPTDTGDGSPERDQDTIQFVNSIGSSSPSIAEVEADALFDTLFALKPEYRAGAQWLMSSTTLAAVRKLKGSDGHYLWQRGIGASVDFGDGFLLGKPIRVSEYMDAIATNSHPVLVGDFDAAYELIRIGGLSITRDEVTVPGKTKLYIRQRFGGRLTDNDALKTLKTVVA